MELWALATTFLPGLFIDDELVIYFTYFIWLTFDCSTTSAILASSSLLSFILIYSMPMVLRRGILNKLITHSICRIENTIIDLKIMCLCKHIYLRYFMMMIKSYQEIVLKGKLVHTIFCSFGPFTNISSLNWHIFFGGLSYYGIFPNTPCDICTS